MKFFTSNPFFLSLPFLFLASGAFAQLTLDFDMTPANMAQNLVGTGVEIFNTQVTAADSSFAYYYSTGTELGNSDGVLLTTGKATNAIGPNNSSGLPLLDGQTCLNCDQFDNDFPGSPLLTLANGGLTTWDATTFEFDIVPQGDSLSFDFVFASEEYLEWVGSPFNDVFGFFITGPNVGVDVNIALIPETNDPVAINSVNNVDNSGYYYNNQNPLGQFIQYDGFTTGLAANIGGLTPCEVYHIKLIIADGSDRIYDSAVFVSKIESNPVTVTASTVGGIDYMIEGCNNGTILFESTFIPTEPYEVNFIIEGSAEYGIDYTTDPDLTPFYNPDTEVYTLFIDPGDSTVSFDILTIFDGITEIGEFITIQLVDQTCEGFEFQSSVDFYIEDLLEVTVSPSTATICNGQCVMLDGDALQDGSATFSWDPITGLSDPNSLDPEACPTTSTTYTLTSNIADCEAEASVVVTVTEPIITFNANPVTCTNGSNGDIDVTVTDATDPISYTWTQDGVFYSNDEDLADVPEGEYCVTVVDSVGCTATDCIEIITTDVLSINGIEFSDYSCFPISCNGACDGSLTVSATGGTGLYSYVWIDALLNVVSSAALADDLCAGTYNVTITDSDGCQVSQSYTLNEPDVLEIEVIGSVDILCTGEETGIATVTTTGGCPPYFYSWSHDPNLSSPVAINLGAGLFTVTVSDVNGCTSAESVTITINGPEDPLNVTIDAISNYSGGYNVSCPSASDGTIDITIDGGTPAYSVVWVHDQTGDTYFIEDLSGIPCGTYELTVTDDNGCSYTDEVELTCVPDFDISFTTIPNLCGDPNGGNGEIHIVSAGSHGGPFTYSWSGPSCPCSGADLTGLNSGSYTVVITDAIGCSTILNINVGTNDSFTVSGTIADATCGGTCDGSIDLEILPAGVYAISWTGPDGFTSSNEAITDLCAGIYEATVTAGACEETFTYEVDEPEPIDIDFINILPPFCFGQNNGSVTVSPSGGTGALDIQWLPNGTCFFGGSTNATINNLFECTYVVTVTDATGCFVTDSIFLDAPQVMDIFVSVIQFDGGYNISCNGESDGEISVSVSGGSPDCVTYAPECYSYDWTSCDPVNFPDASYQPDLSAGTYCVVVTDSNGCVATTEIPMVEPDPMESAGEISDYNGFGVSCDGFCDGWISPEVIGGSGTYLAYTWISGDIGTNDPQAETLVELCPGVYELLILDTNNCSDTITFTITEPSELGLSVDNTTDISCFGYSDGTIAVSGTGGVGPYDFEWNEGEYFGNVLGGLPADTFNLEMTDANGCMLFDQVILNQPDSFVVDLLVPVIDNGEFEIPCVGDSSASIFTTIIGGIPDYEIVWSGPGIININDLNQVNLPAGTYTIVVTDDGGCEATATAEITEPDTPLSVDAIVSSYPSGFPLSCFGACDGFIDITANGGVAPYTYIWELNDMGDTLSFAEDLTNLCSGFYEVLVIDANGCDTLLQFDITEPLPIQSNAILTMFGGGFNVSCVEACDGSISIDPTGGIPEITWEWMVGGISGGSDSTLTGICAGEVITLTMTDAVGCESIEVFTLTQPEPITFNATVINDSPCTSQPDGSISVVVSGGVGSYDVSWNPDLGTSLDIVALGEGTYCLTVVDENGCEHTECWTITSVDTLDGAFEVVDATCGLCNGSISLSIIGGTPPYTIQWLGPTAIPDDETNPTDLCAGEYDALITDAEGCFVIIEMEVLGPLAIEIGAVVQNPLCFEDCNGSIDLTITNGEAPLLFEWTDASGNSLGNQEDLDDLCQGTYSVEVTDANGCVQVADYGLSHPDSLTINGFSPLLNNGYNVSDPGGNDGTIETDVTGGTPDYSYDWEGPTPIDGDESMPEGLTAGEYLLTITDANGCMKDTVIVVIEPDDLALPTGLTPNGDGDNDYYVILGIDQHPNNTFQVFNRWGNLVYDVSGYNNEWNGQNNNEEDLPDGTYFVVFEAGQNQFATYVDLRR
jgi:gliding motility-associated-like protein